MGGVGVGVGGGGGGVGALEYYCGCYWGAGERG